MGAVQDAEPVVGDVAVAQALGLVRLDDQLPVFRCRVIVSHGPTAPVPS
jgi:hypothetical protein